MNNRKLTRNDMIHIFRKDYKSLLEQRPIDYPALRTAWNDMIDFYIKDGQLPQQAGNWGKPHFVEPSEKSKDYIVVDIYPNKPTISVRKGKSLLAQIKGDDAAFLLADYFSMKERPDFVTYLDKKVDFNVY